MYIITNDSEGKICFLVEDGVKHLIYQRMGRNISSIRVFPFSPVSLSFVQGDLIIAARAGSYHLSEILGLLGLAEVACDISDGYRINFHEVLGRSVVTIIGSDLLGLSSGLADLLEHAEINDEGMVVQNEKVEERAAFDYRVFWTWDNRITWGEENSRICWAEVFVDDYKRLIDFCAQSRINAIIIWGFLRDEHGGVDAAQELCNYAKSRGVRLLPGVGTSRYGGFYFSGNHPFSSIKWLEQHPDYALINIKGERAYDRLCPSKEENIKWLMDGTRWLIENFDIGGVNIEHGNYLACYCEECQARRAKAENSQFYYYQDMVQADLPVILEAQKMRDDLWIMYATYTGFNIGMPEFNKNGTLSPISNTHGADIPKMGIEIPGFIKEIPSSAICQWTLTSMIHEPSIPLIELLEDGSPEILVSAPEWPENIKPPAEKNCGYIQQRTDERGGPVLSSIKEACFRGNKEGLQGITIYGEVSGRYIPQELNYRAFSHFLFNPEDSLRDFARVGLAPIVGGEELSQIYIELLAKIEGESMTNRDIKELTRITDKFRRSARFGSNWGAYHRWQWLCTYANVEGSSV